eukprot:82281_1
MASWMSTLRKLLYLALMMLFITTYRMLSLPFFVPGTMPMVSHPETNSNILIVMSDNRFGLEFSNDYYFYTLMINILYAERYKYSFVALQMESDQCGMKHPSNINWCKIQALSYYLHLDAPGVDWILLLDSDSMLSYFSDVSFFEFLDKYLGNRDPNTIHIIVGEDHPGWHWMQINDIKRQEVDGEMHANGIPVVVANAGALFVRNSLKSKQMIDEWLTFSSKHKWATKWLRKWPAEQAVFNCLLLNMNEEIFAFEYDSKVINIGNGIRHASYVNHVTSYYKKQREERIPVYLRSILEKSNQTNITTLKHAFDVYFQGSNPRLRKTEKTFKSIQFNQYALRFPA